MFCGTDGGERSGRPGIILYHTELDHAGIGKGQARLGPQQPQGRGGTPKRVRRSTRVRRVKGLGETKEADGTAGSWAPRELSGGRGGRVGGRRE